VGAEAAQAARAAPAPLRLFVGAVEGRAEGSAGPTLAPGAAFDLPDAAAAHVKVRRLQPGATLQLFDGTSGDDWPAVVQAIGRGAVGVRVGVAPVPAPAAELPVAVALAFGMPANERVDALVEKATELGVAALWPLISERTVLRLQGERAERRRAHWQAVAAAACEQCGRARVPRVHAVQSMAAWLGEQRGPQRAGHEDGAPSSARWLLSTRPEAPALAAQAAPAIERWASPAAEPGRSASPWPGGSVVVLSGPEGGLAPAETEAALAAGFSAVSLGPRVLRADTAPLAVLAWLGIALAQRPGPKSGA